MMEEEHYDTPWEYKNRFLNALKPRPVSSNVLPSCSSQSPLDLRNQHKSMVIRPSENNSPSSPPTGKALKRSSKFKENPFDPKGLTSKSSNSSGSSGNGDYPFIKNVHIGRSSLSSVLMKKFNKFNETDLIHENIDRIEAEQLLMPRAVGEFLLRKRSEGNLALSLKATEGVLHIKLEKRDNNAWVLGEGPQFPSISGCLKYYYRTALPIRGSEHVLLRSPLLASPVH
ncbi:hypothetical protein FO519_003880 [Halicephalobus sp. NKZ332]|nr:hypothetical protein FO519_003880 [Halicephalobus sp. NKZ332]